MSVNVGSLIATLSADHAPLRADLAKGQKMFEDYGAKSEKAVSGVGASIKGLLPLVGSLVTAAGAMGLAKSFFDSAVQAERLATSLDTITKGHGKETFEILDKWAAKLPVNTAKAIDTYRMLSAMGLKPTIKDMTTLVDTTMAMGGSPEIMERVARALGQMGAKGKISAEELMQLTEVGIPAYEILQEKLGITSKQMENLGKSGHTANEAITAIMEGLNERFGGASEKFQHTWGGVMERMADQWDRFKRRVMTGNGDMFSGITGSVETLIAKIEELSDNGTLNEWADRISMNLKSIAQQFLGVAKVLNWTTGNKQRAWDIEIMQAQLDSKEGVQGRLKYWEDKLLNNTIRGRLAGISGPQGAEEYRRAQWESIGPEAQNAITQMRAMVAGATMGKDSWMYKRPGSGELPGSAKKPGAVALAELTKGELKELMGESPEYLDLLSASRNPTKLSQLMEKAAPSFEDAGFARFQERAKEGEEYWKTFVVDWVRDGELGSQSVQDSLEEPFRVFQDNVASANASVADFMEEWRKAGTSGEAADFSLFPWEKMKADRERAEGELEGFLADWKREGEALYEAMGGDKNAAGEATIQKLEKDRKWSMAGMDLSDYVDGWQKMESERVAVSDRSAAAIKEIWDEQKAAMISGVGQLAGVTGDAAGLMRQLYEDSGGQAKEYWEAYKAMTIAETIAATAMGVVNVWTSPLAKVWPAAMAMSAFVGALGATKVALIANQQPAKSFAEGGVFMRPFAGRITAAEDGKPEVIAPLSKLPGLLRQAQEEGGGGGDMHVTNNFGGVSGVDPGTLIAVGRAATQGSMVGVATAMRKSAAMRELMRSVG